MRRKWLKLHRPSAHLSALRATDSPLGIGAYPLFFSFSLLTCSLQHLRGATRSTNKVKPLPATLRQRKKERGQGMLSLPILLEDTRRADPLGSIVITCTSMLSVLISLFHSLLSLLPAECTSQNLCQILVPKTASLETSTKILASYISC